MLSYYLAKEVCTQPFSLKSHISIDHLETVELRTLIQDTRHILPVSPHDVMRDVQLHVYIVFSCFTPPVK